MSCPLVPYPLLHCFVRAPDSQLFTRFPRTRTRVWRYSLLGSLISHSTCASTDPVPVYSRPVFSDLSPFSLFVRFGFCYRHIFYTPVYVCSPRSVFSICDDVAGTKKETKQREMRENRKLNRAHADLNPPTIYVGVGHAIQNARTPSCLRTIGREIYVSKDDRKNNY